MLEAKIIDWALTQGLSTVAAVTLGWFLLNKVDKKLDILIEIFQKQNESMFRLLERIENDHAACREKHNEIIHLQKAARG